LHNNQFLIWWSRLRIFVSTWRYLLAAGFLVVALLVAGIPLLAGVSWRTVPVLKAENGFLPLETAEWHQKIPASRLAALLPGNFFDAAQVRNQCTVLDSQGGGHLQILTTLDKGLQSRLHKLFARYHPQLGAGVVIDLADGAVCALADWRHPDEGGRIIPLGVGSLCLTSRFPAASLFKIVTAYGLLCRSGVDPGTTFSLIGRRHTLYRYQLGLGRSRYRWKPQEVTLKEAFARSINPVFGRIGIDYFPSPKLIELARDLAFNRPIAFDLPLATSLVEPPQSDYQRAETASGFIRTTLISPLHAALLGGFAVAGEKLPAPYLFRRVLAENGAELYLHQPGPSPFHLQRPEACRELAVLMRATVRYGTAAKSFRYLKRRSLYRKLDLGGKTGSLDMPDGEHRCEWFAGFGQERQGTRRYAVAVVLVHGEKRTISSGYIASELLAAALKSH
jgi:cell division protein FtsI/penicillin-binding protein 2